MKCTVHDQEVISSNHGWAELGVSSTVVKFICFQLINARTDTGQNESPAIYHECVL